MTGIENILKEKGIFVGKTKGDSMQPMLVEGRDNVIIIPPKFPLKKYDVPVYRREDRYVMHRVIKVTKNGYIICGDNRTNLERDVKDKDIVGVLAAFYHNGELVRCTDKKYLRYSKKVCRSLLVRKIKAIINVLAKKQKKL